MFGLVSPRFYLVPPWLGHVVSPRFGLISPSFDDMVSPRFGDQILQMDGVSLAGFSSEKVFLLDTFCMHTDRHDLIEGSRFDEEGTGEQHCDGCEGSTI